MSQLKDYILNKTTTINRNVVETIDNDAGGSGGGGVFYVHVVEEDQSYKLDKTYAEIKAAFENGQVLKILNEIFDGNFYAYHLYNILGFGYYPLNDVAYYTIITDYRESELFMCENETDYPIATDIK